jgi:hypothetical protein
MARTTMIASIVLYCGWGVVKLVFYGSALRYLRRATVRQLYVSQSALPA